MKKTGEEESLPIPIVLFGFFWTFTGEVDRSDSSMKIVWDWNRYPYLPQILTNPNKKSFL